MIFDDIGAVFKLFTAVGCLSIQCKLYKIQDNQVFYMHDTQAHSIKNIDINTFEELKYGYAKDKDNVIYHGNVLPIYDVDNFKIIDSNFSIDKNKAYFLGVGFKIEGSFKILNGIYASDGKNIYYGDKNLSVCSVENFVIFHKEDADIYSWATDGCHYYINGNMVQSSDYENIIIFKNSDYAKDSEFAYKSGEKMNYKDGVKFFDVDIKSFDVNKYGDEFDKYGEFDYERRNGVK
jgi:hypothetical protein